MRKHNPTLYTLSERDSDDINDDDENVSWQHEEHDPVPGPSNVSASSNLNRSVRSSLKGRQSSHSKVPTNVNTKQDIYSQFVKRYRTKEHRYVDEMEDFRSDPDSHYYHKGLGQLVDVGDASDDEDYMSLIGGNDGIIEGSMDEMAHPVTEKDQRRLEWQSLLSSVLSGEVLKSEKTRLAVALDSFGDEQNNFNMNIWLGIRAKFHGRSIEEEKRKLDEKRIRIVDGVIDEIMNFRVVQDEAAPTNSAMKQVTNILHRLDVAQSLYPHLKAFYLDKPKAQEGPFQARCDALNTWFTILSSLKRHLTRLRRWTGSDSLDVNHPNPNSEITVTSQGSVEHPDGTSFVERLLKEESMQRTFEKGFLVTVHAFLGTVRDAHVNLAAQLKEMNLPTFENELVPLISFPTKLAQASLRLRLDYVGKLEPDVDVLIIDQMTEDLKLNIGLACTLKRQYQAFLAPDPDGNWALPPCISEDYDSTILEALTQFFKLLHWKLKSGVKGIYLKETDVLEAQWATYNDVSLTAGGSSLVAEHLCSLTNKLMVRVTNYFDTQVRVPLSDKQSGNQSNGGPVTSSAPSSNSGKASSDATTSGQRLTDGQIINWYSKILDGVRLRYRKLQRFARVLTQRFSNSAEYSIDDVAMDHLINLLVLTDHFLVYTQTMEEESIYIVASGSLYDRPDLIRRILVEAFHVDEIASEEGGVRAVSADYLLHDSDEVGYLLVLTPHTPFIWHGRVMFVPVPNISLDLKEGRIRLIADGSYGRLNYAKQVFSDCMELVEGDDDNSGVEPLYLTCLVETQAHLPSVNRELRKIVRATNRLAESIVDSVHHVKRSLRGASNSQDLLGNWYLFASEHGAHAHRYMEKSSLARFNRLLVKLAVSWASFICDDCDPTDRKTFKWTVNSLEFIMQRTKRNILHIPDDQFELLKAKVGHCMSLLINHFDILGARSNMEAKMEKEKQEMLLRSKVVDSRLDEEDFPPCPSGEEGSWYLDGSTRKFWDRVSKALQELEERTVVIPQYRGKVLDDEKLEDRSLVFLASSSSNISIRWQQGRFIGAGAFGSVYLAMNLDSGSLMAVKEIKFQELSGLPNLYAQIKDELSVMEMLHHPNVVEYYGIEVHRDKVYIFEEYCQGGSLAALLEHGRIEDERILQLYTVQMLDGLSYLHSQGIVHRDIKPDNILLDQLGRIKFVDFGAAKILAKNQHTLQRSRRSTDAAFNAANGIGVMSNGLTGTPMYMSPEMIKNDRRGRHGATDIWSLGCVILQCATGRKPWSNLDNEW
ncbi:STE/STE11 protein kinase, variant 2 [Coprinopsis cinerea AmutBmut pab1-1]|nr:STE/STE11 protein kinase, variant 2 [Coprinopsis cinerea AmutBmut pab1-1]